jgi:hypothetical protein
MYTTPRKFDELHTVATPVQGTYRDYIGSALINDIYTVKVMLKSGSLDVTNNKKTTTYKFTQGYIMIKPLID